MNGAVTIIMAMKIADVMNMSAVVFLLITNFIG